MYLARVMGTCIATVKTAGLSGRRLLVVQPLDFNLEQSGLPMVALDTVRAGVGDLVIYVTSREAAKALDDSFNPVDAALLGIVDHVDYEPWCGESS